MSSKPRVGVIGCGAISKSYLTNMQRHGILDVVACADIDMEKARGRAEEFKIPRAIEPEKLLSDPEVEFVLNLTIPQAHVPVAMSAIEHNKHVYVEKPLGVTREEAKRLCDAARQKSLRVGCAPDTFMGAGLQACRRLIDEGKIGQPISVEVVFNLGAGYKNLDHFHWRKGAGVLMDIGPYYFTAMAALLGPMKRISAFTRFNPAPALQKAFPNWKQLIEVPSHTAAIVEFQGGALGNLTFTTEMCGYYDVLLKIYGCEATMICPDPNMFGGEVVITSFGEEKHRETTAGDFAADGRGVGLADMALAHRAGRPHRASDALAYHVLDAMLAVTESAERGAAVTLSSTMERPSPFRGFEQ